MAGASGQRSQCWGRLLELGVDVVCGHKVSALAADGVGVTCIYTGRASTGACNALLPVTVRKPQQTLYEEPAAVDDLSRYAALL